MKSTFARQTFWLVVRQRTARLDVYTIAYEEQVLPIFSFEEEAEMFLRLGVSEKGWRVRESTCGELASLLYGPCRDIGQVSLDLLPDAVGGMIVECVSLNRKEFAGALLMSDPVPPAAEKPRLAGVAS